jgi:hypothetical protein
LWGRSHFKYKYLIYLICAIHWGANLRLSRRTGSGSARGCLIGFAHGFELGGLLHRRAQPADLDSDMQHEEIERARPVRRHEGFLLPELGQVA